MPFQHDDRTPGCLLYTPDKVSYVVIIRNYRRTGLICCFVNGAVGYAVQEQFEI